jgi:4-deoxy-L-threo-5-hexosulose-uronate ketol-isomerase
MEIRFETSPREAATLDTAALREQFHVPALMKDDQVVLVYSHYDRVIIGGAKPMKKTLTLGNPGELKAEYFLERREIGIINVGGEGTVEADGKQYAMNKLDCVYLGKETKKVSFTSSSKKDPAVFYLLSAPAHHKYPSKLMPKAKATPVDMGDKTTSNERTIYKYIHLDGIRSCQLVMGLTVLKPGSVWNSVPPHTHTRRMEVYFYFDVPEQHRVFHFMGQEKETRHIVVANHEAVISPPWSMHFGCGTTNYGFIWGMAGENQVFTDMDQVALASIR